MEKMGYKFILTEVNTLGVLLMGPNKEKANIFGPMGKYILGNSKMDIWKEKEPSKRGNNPIMMACFR